MCKEGCVRLGQEGGCLCDDGRREDCLVFLKRRCTRKEGRGNKDFKKEGDKMDQGVGICVREWGSCTCQERLT